MGTKKKTTQPGKLEAKDKEERKITARPQQSAAFEAALKQFTTALNLFHKGAYPEAMEIFRSLEPVSGEEPVLAGRARTYAVVCERKVRSGSWEPRTPEERYRLGVAQANEGRLEEALRLYDLALQESPDHPGYLYARASVRALQGNAEAAAADLKRAIQVEPHLRFQAANDPDFESVRDDPVFIDVIEPTPSGV